MWLKNLPAGMILLAAFGVGHQAAAADPPARAGNDVVEVGGFECAAKKADGGKLDWTCPAQTFHSKFKESPAVHFSISGFDRIAPADTGLSLGIDTKEEVSKEGFQPIVESTASKPTADKSTISVTWIASGEGDRGGKKARMTREEKLKLRESRQQEKTKN